MLWHGRQNGAVTDTETGNRPMMSIRNYFRFEEHDTSIRTEALAGVTTFLTMSYIIVVNPAILSQAITVPGYSQGQVVQMLAVTTILAAFVSSLAMALYAKRPFGIATGMGSNAFLAFVIVIGLGIPWQTGLAALFVEGLIFMSITVVGARRYIVELIPRPVKFSVGAGIGLFLLFLGLQQMQVVVSSDSTLVQLGSVASNPVAIVAVAGLGITILMYARGIKGSILFGILLTGLAGWAITLAGIVERGVLAPESLPAVQYDFTPLLGAFLEGFKDIEPVSFLLILFTFFILDFFSTAGTLLGLSQLAGFLNDEGNLPEMDKPLLVDAFGTTIGSVLGTTTQATFVESSTGIEVGGRTGLTALVVAALFFMSLILVPVVATLPLYASNIALVIVGLIMLRGVTDIEWSDPAWAIPAGLTISIMPLTASIIFGLAAGIISYPIVKAAKEESDDVNPVQWLLALLFVGYFIVRTGGILG